MGFHPLWKNRRKFSERAENEISFVQLLYSIQKRIFFKTSRKNGNTERLYILFDGDVTDNIVLSSLATKNIEKYVIPDYGFSDYSDNMDITYTQ